MENNEKKESNIDEKNLKIMESFSAQWWDPNSGVFSFHSMNPMRISLIRDGLIKTGMIKAEDKNKPDVLKGINILDVGCGAGVLTEELAKLGAKMTALDPSEELIRVAKDHLGQQPLDIEYLAEYIQEHSIKNADKYDVVVASEVIEHVPGQEEFLIELTKCVKPNGSIFITTPNRTFVSWVGMLIAEHILKVLPKGVHDWNIFITPSEVEEIFKKRNCKTVEVRGVWYTPIFDIFTLVRYTGMHYGLHAVKQDNKKQK